jgi:hypothetical protein
MLNGLTKGDTMISQMVLADYIWLGLGMLSIAATVLIVLIFVWLIRSVKVVKGGCYQMEIFDRDFLSTENSKNENQ